MPDVKQVLADPRFYELPENERIRVLSSLDQNFAGLPQSEQFKVISTRRTPEAAAQQAGPGVMSRFAQGAASRAFGTENQPLRPETEAAIDVGVRTGAGQFGPMASVVAPMMKNTIGQASEGNLAGAGGATVAEVLAWLAPWLAGKTGLPAMMEQSAARSYGKVLAPTKEVPKAIAQTKVIPQALERGVMAATETGLRSKVAGQLDAASQALEDAWAALPEGSKLNLNPVWNAMNDLIAGSYVKGTNVIERPEIVREANKIKAKIIQMRSLPEQKRLGQGVIAMGPGEPVPPAQQAILSQADIAPAGFQRWGTGPTGSIERGAARDIRPLEQRMQSAFTQESRYPALVADDLERAIKAQQLEFIEKGSDDYVKNSIKARLLRSANDVGTVSAESARSWRQLMDKFIASKPGGFAITKPLAAEAEVKKVATNAIRAELANEYPDIAKINAEFSFWKNFSDILEATATRRTGQVGPLGRKIVLATGAAAGLPGGPTSAVLDAALVGAADKTFTSAGWRTVSAVTKDRLAKALASGDAALASGVLHNVVMSGRYVWENGELVPVEQK